MAGDSASDSAWPPPAPTSCGGAGSACRGAGRGCLAGTLLQLGRSRKGAGRAKNVRKRLFTRGRGGIPSPSPDRPPPPWTERWGYHHPGRPWEVMGRGTHSDLSRPETSNPPPSVNTAPNSGRLAGSSTPESSRLGARGFPGLGGCRVRSALPPPLFYKPDLETESWTQGSPALGGKESTAEPLTQPIPNEPRT